MNSVQSVLRSLVIYGVCIPLAVFLGYLLADPQDLGSFFTIAVVVALLCAPLFIKFHYPMMLLSWNMAGVLFFLPGRPQLWMATVAISFMISFTHRILNKEVRGIHVPEVTRPLITLLIVVIVTAKLTGGIGLRSMGAEVYGGKRYINVILGIMAFFAFVAHPIPPHRAKLYSALFFLGGLTCLIGDVFPLVGGPAAFLFWIFPPNSVEFEIGVTRFNGASAACTLLYAYMMVRYGIRGIFDMNRPWRLAAFAAFALVGMLGGYRSMAINFLGVFVIQFFLEGLHRTRLLPVMALMCATLMVAAAGFSTKLPLTIQRALAFLPIRVDPMVRDSAESSSTWRLTMWKAVLPQVPQYLLMGKGLAMAQRDYNFAAEFGEDTIRADQWGAAMAGDYHNGPLSILIPFGIWGMLAFLWFLYGAFRVLWNNYRYGDPALRILNTFLLANFAIRIFMYFVIVGGFTSDMVYFVGIVGFSVALNHGIARPVASPAMTKAVPVRNLATILPRHRPVLGR